jgi:hypothetical protein
MHFDNTKLKSAIYAMSLSTELCSKRSILTIFKVNLQILVGKDTKYH